MIEDIIQDRNQQYLNVLAHQYRDILPDFVKSASIASLVPVQPEEKQCVADPINNRFPCHNKAATFVSYLYYLSQRDKYAPAHQRIVDKQFAKYAALWNIRLEMRQAWEKASSQPPKRPLNDSEYAIVASVKKANGEKTVIRRVPISTAQETAKAAAWFVQNLGMLRNKMSFAKRADIAQRILDQAEKLGANLGESERVLRKCACEGISEPSYIGDQIRRRLKLMRNVSPEFRKQAEALAQKVGSTNILALDPATRRQMAELLDDWDHTHKLRESYGRGIDSPEETLFKIGRHDLDYFRKCSCSLATGSMYLSEDFEKLSVADVRSILGDEIADAVAKGMHVDGQKMAEIAATLPRPQAELLESLLEEQGIKPFHKTAHKRTLAPLARPARGRFRP